MILINISYDPGLGFDPGSGIVDQSHWVTEIHNNGELEQKVNLIRIFSDGNVFKENRRYRSQLHPTVLDLLQEQTALIDPVKVEEVNRMITMDDAPTIQLNALGTRSFIPVSAVLCLLWEIAEGFHSPDSGLRTECLRLFELWRTIDNNSPFQTGHTRHGTWPDGALLG